MQKEILLGLWPGWQVWYVRIHQPPHVCWCALPDSQASETPRPVVKAHNGPDELEGLMRQRAAALVERTEERARRGVTLSDASSNAE